MADIKKINNYDIKDEVARNEIEELRNNIPENIATESYVDETASGLQQGLELLTSDVGIIIDTYALKTDIPSLDGLATEQYIQNEIGYRDGDISNLGMRITELESAIGDINAILDAINGEEI